MRDQRIDKWAEVLVNYSLGCQKGQYVVVAGEPEALPLIEACHEQLIKAGCFVELFITPSNFSETLFRLGSDEQIGWTGEAMLHAAKQCDVYLRIGSEVNSSLLANFPAHKSTLSTKARRPILEAILGRAAEKKMRWAYTHFPTPAAAQDAGMGTYEYQEFVFDLGYLNHADPIKEWKRVEQEQQKLIDFLQDKKELHFQNSEGTDLRVNVDGMKWVNCCGRINFPDGEVYTGPKLDAPDGGVNGVARFSFPTNYRSVEVHDIELFFEKGAVYEANASKGQEFLRQMIGQDEGAKFVGEIAIGTNNQMNRITKNILFDEKFGGTFHLALGSGYPQTGNTNKSALHWDMIFDLRKEGSITADGKPVLKDGKLLV